MESGIGLKEIEQALAGNGAAFRSRTKLRPVGGDGDKIFPATYEKGACAEEKRVLPGETTPVDCVLIDSVQSQANRMEERLLGLWRSKQIPLPVISVDLMNSGLDKPLRITSLEAPHRIADALLRDSELDGKPFRDTTIGKGLSNAGPQNSSLLFEYCPTALIFGMWDSTGPKGGSGAKYPRAISSEIVGINAVKGVRTSSRIDPAGIVKVGKIYESKDGRWTTDESEAKMKDKKPVVISGDDKGKKGAPSEINHGNITPAIALGGYTISYALQTIVISLPAIRRLSFPISSKITEERDLAGQVALTCLGLCAATSMMESGYDLRSRCQLIPMEPIAWELLSGAGETPRKFQLTSAQSVKLFADSIAKAKGAGLRYEEMEIELKPSKSLVDLIKKSQSVDVKVDSDIEG